MLTELRCKKCNKKFGENFEGKEDVLCERCGYMNKFREPVDNTITRNIAITCGHN